MARPTADRPAHCVAVIGGATAGAVVAGRLAERGALVVVFEQNPRPYGKIEDGLPRWHVALRQKEYAAIGERLSAHGVHFVPNTRIGRDVDFAELCRGRDWGFDAVVLACGAWRDRPLAVEGADSYVGKGLIYQNPFIIWFNHSEEADYSGERFEALDGSLVVGGGLASIDVVKVLMLENVRAKLAEREIEASLVDLEVKGIPKVLAAHGLAFEDLGLQCSTLLYRRRIEDMPLMEAPEGATPERMEKVFKGRARMLEKAQEKYRFKIEPLCAPDGLIVEDDRLVGLKLRRTKIEDGRVIPTDETFELRGACIISSIGSIPEPIPGIPTKGELFDFCDWDDGRIDGYPTVFSVGNVVTGKGNIVASRKHAIAVSERAIEAFLGLGDRKDEAELLDAATQAVRAEAEQVAAQIEAAPPKPGTRERILQRVRERQKQVGYDGDYASWIAAVTPSDMA